MPLCVLRFANYGNFLRKTSEVRKHRLLGETNGLIGANHENKYTASRFIFVGFALGGQERKCLRWEKVILYSTPTSWLCLDCFMTFLFRLALLTGICCCWYELTQYGNFHYISIEWNIFTRPMPASPKPTETKLINYSSHASECRSNHCKWVGCEVSEQKRKPAFLPFQAPD